MKKILSCICALSVCAAMLSACGTQENTAQGETTLNPETTAAEEASETTAPTEVDTEATTEETEPEPEINYQKKRVVYYPADGDNYVSIEYEYGDDGYYKAIGYGSEGNIFYCEEYKNNIMIKCTYYNDGKLNSIIEYDESELNYITKTSEYNDNEELSYEFLYDYQFNDERTEALLTLTSIYYETNEKYENTFTKKYEFDEAGHITYIREYDESGNVSATENHYEYDDNGNKILYAWGDIFTEVYEYDDNNNLIHYNYSSDNRSSDTYYDYDEYGRQIGWTVYDADGNETSHSVVEYE